MEMIQVSSLRTSKVRKRKIIAQTDFLVLLRGSLEL